jgi:hypothetical protein
MSPLLASDRWTPELPVHSAVSWQANRASLSYAETRGLLIRLAPTAGLSSVACCEMIHCWNHQRIVCQP